MKQSWVEFAPLLGAVSRGWRKALDTAVAELNFTDAKALPLLVLLRQGDLIPQGVLAERVGIEGATIVRIIDELESDQMIQRVSDKSDRRVKLIQLSEQGRSTALKLEEIAMKLRTEFLGDIDPELVDHALEVIHQLHKKLQMQTR